MEDLQIVELYWQRNQQAVAETERKYGSFCYGIAKNILSVREDAEECVNDTYHRAWNAIPPQRPVYLRAWLGRIVRNLAVDRWERNRAQKRYAGMTELLSELEECIPSPQTVEQAVEEKELAAHISVWLRTLAPEDRTLFIRRYWEGAELQSLAKEQGISPGKLAQRMYRLRAGLRSALEREGVSL